jgi:hypothetical protein
LGAEVNGPIIEFLDNPPALVSAGHDGLFPYEFHPFDELYVFAYRWSNEPREQSVEIWLPYNRTIEFHNSEGLKESVRVHKSGFLWHGRTREIQSSSSDNWLSEFGFSSIDPRRVAINPNPIFAVLPGSPMQDNLLELLQSTAWRDARDFHSRNRDWMLNRRSAEFQHVVATRYERNGKLIEKFKQERGSACQICGFTFRKIDGSDYSEVHHLESLANGGFDIASNCIVLCANCHKRFHYGMVEIIEHTATNLVVRLDGIVHSCVVGEQISSN